MNHQFLQSRLRSAFPESSDAYTARAVREGVLLADDLVSGSDILNTLIGKDLRGHIRRAGIMMKLRDFSEGGDLPFEVKMLPMPRGSWHYIEIASQNITAHVHRTDTPGAFPADTPVRHDERLSNQPDFFLEDVARPFSEVVGAKRINAWLTHGSLRDGTLTHISWRIPDSAGEEWLAHVDVLAGATNSLSTPVRKTVDPSEKLRFKKEVEDFIETSGKSDAANDAE